MYRPASEAFCPSDTCEYTLAKKKNGTNTTEFVYGNFQDWNNPLFKIEALYPGTIVERRNGTVVRNLTAKVTEIGQVYVVVPVPDSVKAGGK